MFSRPRLTAGAATGVLAAALAVGASVASWATPPGRLLAMPATAPDGVVLLLLVLAFLCAEIALVHVELRRQAYSFSASGVALVLGVMFCDAHQLVLARVAGALLVFAYQRPPALKMAYNLAAYSLEAALVGLAAHNVLGSHVGLTLSAALLCYLIAGSVDLVMSALVLVVIAWHQGRIALRQAVDVCAPAAMLSAVCTGTAFGIAAVLDEGALGGTLVACFAGASVVVYRSYLVLRRRHQSLELMHEFVGEGVGASAVDELAEKLLARTRRLLNAATVELAVQREGNDHVMSIDEADVLTTVQRPAQAPHDWLLTRVTTNDEPIVIPRHTRERGMKQWLIDHEARDVLIVPLTGASLTGVLIVKDRLGEASTFTTDDLTLLQTLAGHVEVALRGTELVQQLRYEATHDSLTQLPNRTLLIERLEAALQAAPGGGGPATVLLLDLDRFKEVNDALGHHVGDALLQVVAARMSSCLPSSATVARLGGDEFAVLLPPGANAAAAAEAAAKTVAAALAVPVPLSEATVTTRASIGISLAAPGLTSADVLRHADTAMYAAKDGDLGIVTYTPELDRGRAERLALLADLHLALERDELELLFQPQLDLQTGEIVSAEALVRWRHPERGLLNPDDFIPLAESSGLIEELTQQVLRKALHQCRAWQDAGVDLVVAVNLSAQNVNNVELPEEVVAALVDAGLRADSLVLEITESSVMGDPDRTVPTLRRLADIGVTLSLDDFGTGYSSLAYLQRLPVSEVKIDRSFVMGMASAAGTPTSEVLVRSIITLGASLGLRVVAEGVENAEIIAELRELGCDLAQGYHIGRPATGAEVADMVLRRRPPQRPRHGYLSSVAG